MQKLDLFDLSLMAAGIFVPLVFGEVWIKEFNINIVDVMVLIMVAGFAQRLRKGNVTTKFSAADKWFLALVLWSGIGLVWAVDFSKSLREAVWILESFLIFYMVEHGLKQETDIKLLLRLWVYGAVITSALGLAYYYMSLASGKGPVLVGSTVGNPNHLSGYLILILPMCLSFAYTKRIDGVFWGLMAVIIAAALVTTSTRGGWYASIIAILAMAVLLRDKRLVIFLFIFGIGASLVFPQLTDRGLSGLKAITGTLSKVAMIESAEQKAQAKGLASKETVIVGDKNGTDRLQLWKIAFIMWSEHPLAGVGTGNYIKLYDTYLDQNAYLDQNLFAREPHSSFIKFLAENGLIGLLVFIGLLFVTFHTVLNSLRRGPYRINPVLTGLICGIFAFLLQSNTNNLFQLPRVSFGFWLLGPLITNRYLD